MPKPEAVGSCSRSWVKPTFSFGSYDITAWVRDGGPGLAKPPGILDLYAFQPSRRVRAELHDE
ncbi:hypothetical protein GCM10020000_84340 [Streptomyces olivoverticillatus]